MSDPAALDPGTDSTQSSGEESPLYKFAIGAVETVAGLVFLAAVLVASAVTLTVAAPFALLHLLLTSPREV